MKQTWNNTYEAPVAEELMIKVETNLLDASCPTYVPAGGGEGGEEDDWD